MIPFFRSQKLLYSTARRIKHELSFNKEFNVITVILAKNGDLFSSDFTVTGLSLKSQ